MPCCYCLIMVVICDISAWQWYGTPPILRAAEIPAEIACAAPPDGLGFDQALFRARVNDRDAERLIRTRLLTDLKGISLPVHVMVDKDSGTHAGKFITARRLPRAISSDDLMPLGNDLFVLSPECTLLYQTTPRSVITMLKMMFEACGLFVLPPENSRMSLTLRELLRAGEISRDDTSWDGYRGYYDARGRRASFLDGYGDELPWRLSFDRFGRATDLWKRPPLTTAEHLIVKLDQMIERAGARGIPGGQRVRKAVRFVRDGAASPAEVQAFMLLCLGKWFGSEEWGDPFLNHRIDFTPETQRIACQGYCIADMLWKDRRALLEVNGEGYHADAMGFKLASGRRAALESMGYEVLEITPAQMADLEQLDTMLPRFAEKLGFDLVNRTPAFLRRRDALHRELFSVPFRVG